VVQLSSGMTPADPWRDDLQARVNLRLTP